MLVDETKQLSLKNNNLKKNTTTTLMKNTSAKNTSIRTAQNNNKISNMNKQKQQVTGNAKASSHTSHTGTVKKQQKTIVPTKSQDVKTLQQSTKSQPKTQPQKVQTQLPNKSANTNSSNATNTSVALPKTVNAKNSEDISGGVQDTIYLCNFRVSVDGDWLCLKELQDLDVGQQNSHKVQQASYSGVQRSKRYSGLSAYGNDDNGILALENFIVRRLCDDSRICCDTQEQHLLTSTTMNARRHALENGFISVFGGGECSNTPRDTAEIERSNLVNICKLVVKELLEQSLRYGRMLDSDHLPLHHFFIVIEHVLGHGLRPKKGILGPRKELWDLLQIVEQFCPEAQDITTSVRDLPTVRTHIGRARAWLRIALMQKKLADYLHALIEHRDDALYEYYESYALMMSDEIIVVMGILVGLNVIDCNLCVKEEDLDSQQGVIDFSLYLRSSSRSGDVEEGNNQVLDESGGGNMIAVLDQKNYIEELNRHLNATVANLQAKVESLTTTNALMKEDLAIARNSLMALQAENQALRQNGTESILTPFRQSVQSNNSSSSDTEKVSLESLTAELAEEKKKNADMDKELKLQISLKAESEVAMKLLEKDIHEKQDTIISLRRQLDDIKQINLEMYRKLQESDASLKHKSDLIMKLEAQKEEMSNTITRLKKCSNENSNLGEALRNTSQTLSSQLAATEERTAKAEADLRIEREWRVSLQEKELKYKENITTLQNCIKELKNEAKEKIKLKEELDRMHKQWSEAQLTLEELGIQLSVNKLKVSEFEERQRQAKQQEVLNSSTSSLQSQQTLEAVTPGIWAPDSIATHCTGCQREFNLTRRKHHCRSCGDIFCKSCSEHTVALLNDNGQIGKPVRVCDACFLSGK